VRNKFEFEEIRPFRYDFDQIYSPVRLRKYKDGESRKSRHSEIFEAKIGD